MERGIGIPQSKSSAFCVFDIYSYFQIALQRNDHNLHSPNNVFITLEVIQ